MTIKIGRAAVGQRLLGPATYKAYTVVRYIPPLETHRGESWPRGVYLCKRETDEREIVFQPQRYVEGVKLLLIRESAK